MIDIIKFAVFNTKPQKDDLYMNEDGMLYMCGDPEWNDKNGWAGKDIKKVVAVLLLTELNLEELKELQKLVWEKNLKDGDTIEIKRTFKVPE